MRRFIMAGSLILSLMLFTGCSISGDEQGSPEPQQSSEQPERKSVYDYYPIKENVRYVYEGSGNEYASYEVYIDFTSGDKVQQRRSNGGTVIADVIEVGEGKVTRKLSREEAYYRENLLEATGGEEEVLLMEPLEKGTTWVLQDGRTRTITDESADVTISLGSYKAVEVTTLSSKDKTVDYYSKDIGLIKSIFTSGNTQVVSSLSKLEEEAAFSTSVNFYYPSGVDDKIYYKSKGLIFKTNDDTNKILETAYKESVAGLGNVFTQNTKINSLKLDNNGIVNIDLSKEFSGEMNAGSLFEAMILQSLTNTFGQYYHSDKVIVTVENKPYESGHIKMEEGEYFQVEYDKVEKVE